jgi:hypothetical protein
MRVTDTHAPHLQLVHMLQDALHDVLGAVKGI